MSHPAWLDQPTFAAGEQHQLPVPSLPYAQHERGCGRAYRTGPQPVGKVPGVHDVSHADSRIQFQSGVLPVTRGMTWVPKEIEALISLGSQRYFSACCWEVV